MSKQSEAKTAQGYGKEPACCKNCKSYTSDVTLIRGAWSGVLRPVENNKRCGIGGFVINSHGHCKLFARKD